MSTGSRTVSWTRTSPNPISAKPTPLSARSVGEFTPVSSTRTLRVVREGKLMVCPGGVSDGMSKGASTVEPSSKVSFTPLTQRSVGPVGGCTKVRWSTVWGASAVMVMELPVTSPPTSQLVRRSPSIAFAGRSDGVT